MRMNRGMRSLRTLIVTDRRATVNATDRIGEGDVRRERRTPAPTGVQSPATPLLERIYGAPYPNDAVAVLHGLVVA